MQISGLAGKPETERMRSINQLGMYLAKADMNHFGLLLFPMPIKRNIEHHKEPSSSIFQDIFSDINHFSQLYQLSSPDSPSTHHPSFNMKFFATMLGSQLLIAAAVLASPIADGYAIARSAAPLPAAVPGCIKERGTAGEDDVNICCLKVKRDAEVAAATAATNTALYEKAMTVREKLGDLIARDAIPGCIKARGTPDEDAVNICCLKLKRDAEASASAAANAFAAYSEMLAFKKL
ncbi:hypothetical protein MMC19_003566 [Ptychographa xylographoides]|nr:hypothetical protein [Ptychographa xylographoides]